MRQRLSGLRVPVQDSANGPLLERLLALPDGSVTGVTVARRSLDARKKPALVWELTVEFDGPEGIPAPAPPLVLSPASPPRGPELLLPPLPGRPRVAVVGTGPAGLFAALALSDAGVDLTILERGDAAEERYRKVMRFWKSGELDPVSNVQFGEGGAGTFSDGKLTCGKRLEKILVVLETLHRFGAPGSILTEAKPHIGTDRLVVVLRQIRRHLLDHGARFRFRSRVVDLLRGEGGPLRALRLESGEEIPVDAAVLALGHSARDTLEMLQARGIPLASKAFAMGVRIEHPQDVIDAIQYGRLSRTCGVPPADYKLTAVGPDGRGVYTFCMCPGGEVIGCSSEAGGVVTNGMSRYRRSSGFANSGIVVQTRPEDFAGETGPEVLRGIAFQRRVERAAFRLGGGTYAVPALRVTDFMAGRLPRSLPRTSFEPTAVPSRLDTLYPPSILAALRAGLQAFDGKMRGFLSDEAILLAPESRTSSPVRIERSELCESPALPGLFPAGEGAGFAGGIVSAALDGLRVARAVRARLAGENPPPASEPVAGLEED